jgi:hypothetical protein
MSTSDNVEGASQVSEPELPAQPHRTGSVTPAVFTARRENGVTLIASVIVEHAAGASPADAIGNRAWERISAALSSTGVDADYTDRLLNINGDIGYPESDIPEPADLAIACALLIDSGAVDPAIADGSVFYARLTHDGTLIPVFFARWDVAQWAAAHHRSLRLADISMDGLGGIDGLELHGCDRLAELVAAWPRTGPDHAFGGPEVNGGER